MKNNFFITFLMLACLMVACPASVWAAPTWDNAKNNKQVSVSPSKITTANSLNKNKWYILKCNGEYLYETNGSLSAKSTLPVSDAPAAVWKKYLFSMDEQHPGNRAWPHDYSVKSASGKYICYNDGHTTFILSQYTTNHWIGATDGLVFGNTWNASMYYFIENHSVVLGYSNAHHWEAYEVTITDTDAPTGSSSGWSGSSSNFVFPSGTFSDVYPSSTMDLSFSGSGWGEFSFQCGDGTPLLFADNDIERIMPLDAYNATTGIFGTNNNGQVILSFSESILDQIKDHASGGVEMRFVGTNKSITSYTIYKAERQDQLPESNNPEIWTGSQDLEYNNVQKQVNIARSVFANLHEGATLTLAYTSNSNTSEIQLYCNGSDKGQGHRGHIIQLNVVGDPNVTYTNDHYVIPNSNSVEKTISFELTQSILNDHLLNTTNEDALIIKGQNIAITGAFVNDPESDGDNVNIWNGEVDLGYSNPANVIYLLDEAFEGVPEGSDLEISYTNGNNGHIRLSCLNDRNVHNNGGQNYIIKDDIEITQAEGVVSIELGNSILSHIDHHQSEHKLFVIEGSNVTINNINIAKKPRIYHDYVAEGTKVYFYHPTKVISHAEIDGQKIELTDAGNNNYYCIVGNTDLLTYETERDLTAYYSEGNKYIVTGKKIPVLGTTVAAIDHEAYNLTNNDITPGLFTAATDLPGSVFSSPETQYPVNGYDIRTFSGEYSVRFSHFDNVEFRPRRIEFKIFEIDCNNGHCGDGDEVIVKINGNKRGYGIKPCVNTEGWELVNVPLFPQDDDNDMLTFTIDTPSGHRYGVAHICLIGTYVDNRLEALQHLSSLDLVIGDVHTFNDFCLSDGNVTVNVENEATVSAVVSGKNLTLTALRAGATDITITVAPTDTHKPASQTITIGVRSGVVVNEARTWKAVDFAANSTVGGSNNGLTWSALKNDAAQTDSRYTKLAGIHCNSSNVASFELPVVNNGGIVTLTVGPREYGKNGGKDGSLSVNDVWKGFRCPANASQEATTQVSWQIAPNTTSILIKKENVECIITSVSWMPFPDNFGGNVLCGMNTNIPGFLVSNSNGGVASSIEPLTDSWMNSNDWSMLGESVYRIWNADARYITIPRSVLKKNTFLRIRGTSWNTGTQSISVTNVDGMVTYVEKTDLNNPNQDPNLFEIRTLDYDESTPDSKTFVIHTFTDKGAVVSIDVITPDFEREVTANKWGTICLPFDVPAGAMHGADAFYKFVGGRKNGSMLSEAVFEEVDHLEAGRAYIFYGDENALVSASYIGCDPSQCAVTPLDDDGLGLYGSYDRFAVKEHGFENNDYRYYVVSSNKLRPASLGTFTGANKAYLDTERMSEPASAPSRRVIFDEDGYSFEDTEESANSIEEIVESMMPTDSGTYDLSGREIEGNARGLIIRDGKMIFRH